ncbi:sensor domain-containing diguanylate cyclase (plasmid) [Ralstonia wenshanensis]|uniref:sensor domain-containing diguanylate cyclase n=1 Tax=Ralstonia wenshanensis TaxID=2842456 RepID=UPI001E31BB75|nr:sensor domain-containing diguanylate cyclase [Ralstonia wenshanensis]UGS88432.1 sensor domain-containing diguanylate cyclase [Ralstonia wenshanensis]
MQSASDSVSSPAAVGVNLIDFFDVTPTSLWLEDYSDLHRLFAQWRAAGVTDLQRFLEENVSRVAACSACIKVLRVNRRTLSMYAAPDAETLTARLADVLRDDMLEAHVGELVQLWSGESSFESRSVNYTLDGRRLDILLKGVVLPDHEQPWDRVLVAVDDITELEDARRRVAASQLYARGVFEHAPVSLWVENFSTIKMLLDEVRMQGITDFRTFTDVHPEFVERCMQEIQVLDVNGFTLEMFKARNRNDLLGRLPEVFRDDMRSHFREQLIDLWDGRLFQQREVINYGLDGNPLNIHLQFSVFPGREKDWDMVLLALTDITARKKAESYVEYLGKHDVLTKLKNRSFYVDEINRLERKGPFPVTVIMIDLNDLKSVNDQLGHAAGDALLRRAGEVLGKAIDKPAHAARIGGDEFAVLLPGADAQAGAALVESLRKLVELNNQFYPGAVLGFSMGCATCHEGGRLEETLREADVAMYEDKRVQHEGRRPA